VVQGGRASARESTRVFQGPVCELGGLFGESKKRIIEISKKSPQIFLPYRLDKAGLCEKLKELDDNFPPPGLWVDYYKINSISDIIYNGIFEQKKRKTVQI
jgi:hypothetical protein